MVFKSTLALCPACSCHVRGEPVCPHCGEALLAAKAGPQARRSAAALAMGLAVAVGGGGCLTDEVITEDDGSAVAADDDDGGAGGGSSVSTASMGISVVSTYGVAPSSGGWGVGGGNGGFGGMNGAGGGDEGGAGGSGGGV